MEEHLCDICLEKGKKVEARYKAWDFYYNQYDEPVDCMEFYSCQNVEHLVMTCGNFDGEFYRLYDSKKFMNEKDEETLIKQIEETRKRLRGLKIRY